MAFVRALAAGLFLLFAATVSAQTYTWVDDAGNMHATDQYALIPPQYRTGLDVRPDIDQPHAFEESFEAPEEAMSSPLDALEGPNRLWFALGCGGALLVGFGFFWTWRARRNAEYSYDDPTY